MDHRGYSRSPPRQDYGTLSAPDPKSVPRRDDRYRRHAGDDHNYGGMYDERPPTRQGRHDDGDGSREYSRDRRYNRPRSPSGDRRIRSRSHSRTREAGTPTDTVILEGVPFGPSLEELEDAIFNNSTAVDFPNTRIRVSASRGNRRAFIQFQSVEDATAFMKAHYPKLYVELEQPVDEAPEGYFESILHYARGREDPEKAILPNAGENWACPSCDFSNYSTRTICKICGTSQAVGNWQESLTGAADAAEEVSSQILVVYPLAAFVDEEMLARELKRLELQKPEPSKNTGGDAPKLKSTAPTNDASRFGAREGSLHRIFLMRDVRSNESFKYGFVEFWSLEDAASAMTKFKMSRSFTVAGCAVTISMIHMGVFIPQTHSVAPNMEHTCFRPLLNSSILVKYRDQHAYPSQLVVTEEPPAGMGASKKAESESSDSKKPKKRKADTSLPGASSKKAVPMAGQLAKWQRKHDELVGGQAPAPRDDESQDSKNIDQETGRPGTKPFEQKGAIKISLSSTKVFGAPSTPSDQPTTAQNSETDTGDSKPIAAAAQEAMAEKVEDYIDRDKLSCLICGFRYKNLDEVGIHEKSRRHKGAMEDSELVKKALPRIAKRDERLRAEAEEADKSQYRDRAKERRQTFNQPKKQTQPNKPKGDPKPSKQDTAGAPSSKPAAPSKGAGMLAKMGWTAGAGLGANGAGRTEVVETNAYQEGVGLGAEGGNLGDAVQLAERRTKGSYADYVNDVQDKARARFNRMG